MASKRRNSSSLFQRISSQRSEKDRRNRKKPRDQEVDHGAQWLGGFSKGTFIHRPACHNKSLIISILILKTIVNNKISSNGQSALQTWIPTLQISQHLKSLGYLEQRAGEALLYCLSMDCPWRHIAGPFKFIQLLALMRGPGFGLGSEYRSRGSGHS